MVEVPVHLNFDHMRIKPPALPQISEPCLTLRPKSLNITETVRLLNVIGRYAVLDLS